MYDLDYDAAMLELLRMFLTFLSGLVLASCHGDFDLVFASQSVFALFSRSMPQDLGGRSGLRKSRPDKGSLSLQGGRSGPGFSRSVCETAFGLLNRILQ